MLKNPKTHDNVAEKYNRPWMMNDSGSSWRFEVDQTQQRP